MAGMKDFVIENGILIKYKGTKSAVVIPASVTSIGNSAFSGCTGLTSVTIPDGVTSIGYGAFEYCTGLTSVTIPDGVTSIGQDAFFLCSHLTLRASAGSYTESYAKENRIPFEAL